MLLVKFLCLPAGQTQESQNRLYSEIAEAIISLDEFCLRDKKDICCTFPSSLAPGGPCGDIFMEVEGLSPSFTPAVHKRLVEKIEGVVKVLYPKSWVECFIPLNK